MTIELSNDGKSATVRIPITIRKRGGRKLIITGDGQQYDGETQTQWAPRRPRMDTPLLMAVLQAFKWKRELDEGRYSTVSELAVAEGKNISYVAHVLRLTLLAPDLVEAIMDGRQPRYMQLQPLMRTLSWAWQDQRRLIQV